MPNTDANILCDQCMDIEIIRRIIGHASVTLTSKKYIHHSTRQLSGGVDVISVMTA